MVSIIRFPGTNCDFDTQYAFEKFGCKTKIIWHEESALPTNTKLVVLAGGFSYGDYLRSGAIAKVSKIMQDVKQASKKGVKILGICNGFQILTETHLLEGSLIRNKNLHFISKNSYLKIQNNDNDFLTKYAKNDVIKLPVAHADGNYKCDNDTLKSLQDNNQILMTYCDKNGNDVDLNGSINHIAGICNKEKNIFGLMPHPERAVEEILGSCDGLNMLEKLDLDNLKYLFIFLIFINAILADDNVSVDETYILYDYAPKNVYQNEPFKISIKFFTSRNDFDYIQTDFKEDIKVIDNNTTWVKEESFYKNTFFISIKRHNYIPEIVIKLVKTLKDTQIDEDSIFDYQTDDKNVENNITLETIILKKREIKLSKLRWLNGASHVLASELNVTDYLVEPYDNNYNQLNLYLSATKANLYDFNIKNKNIKESKLEILKNDFNHSVAIYQALIDKYTNEIKFNYFNTKKSHFEYKTLSVNINNETISTQTDINPHNNSFTNLKFVILLCILTILLIFYILNHKYIYLIMAIIVCSIMIAIKLPFKTMYIPKGTKIKILPIEKSTIFYITDKDTKAEIVKTYNHYKKIIINNKIGWMHENNLNQR